MWGSDADKREFGAIWSLWYGDPSTRDRAAAVPRLLVLADRGYAPAQFAVSMAYFDGDDVPVDYAKAFKYCVAAAEQDYPAAACMMGSYYGSFAPRYDNVCPYDPVAAVSWCRRAAERGNASAQFNLASQHQRGHGIEKDLVEAYVWASLAVLGSTIRFRPAEVLRDRVAAELDDAQRATAIARVSALSSGSLVQPWSEHMPYWKSLAEGA